MATFTVKGMGELASLFAKHAKARDKRVRAAVDKTASKGAKAAQEAVPIAFKELQASIHASGGQIIADAPHAAAVELGSRPHTPPLDPLIRWVKLRGMQGLTATGRVKRMAETKKAFESDVGHGLKNVAIRDNAARRSARQDIAVARQLRTMQSGKSLDADAPTQIARRIQAAISRGGTKPTRFMLGCVPTVWEILDTEMKRALPDR